MKKRLTKEQWKKRRRAKAATVIGVGTLLAVVVLGVFCFAIGKLYDSGISPRKISAVFRGEPIVLERLESLEANEMLLTPNEYSRPQTPLKEVKGIVIHYTANPGTDAEANRNYFENLGVTQQTKASSHYIIGLDGSIVQCIPLNEIAYASNERNEDTISIENCHPDKSGKFSEETYESLVSLTAHLCKAYKLGINDILRHYDVSGKSCPLYFVEDEAEWQAFKDDVADYLKNL